MKKVKGYEYEPEYVQMLGTGCYQRIFVEKGDKRKIDQIGFIRSPKKVSKKKNDRKTHK